MIIETRKSITIPCRLDASQVPEVVLDDTPDPVELDICTEHPEFRICLSAPSSAWTVSAEMSPSGMPAPTYGWTSENGDAWFTWSSQEMARHDPDTVWYVPVTATSEEAEPKTRPVKIKIRPIGQLPWGIPEAQGSGASIYQVSKLDLRFAANGSGARVLQLDQRDVDEFVVRCDPGTVSLPARIEVEGEPVEVETHGPAGVSSWSAGVNSSWETELPVQTQLLTVRVVTELGEQRVPLRFEVG